MSQKSELSAQAINASLGGASAAAQAFKAQLAAEAAANAAQVPLCAPVAGSAPGEDEAQPASLPTGADARTAERKKVTGRARIVFAGGGASLSGKMVDLSVNGACVLLDDMVPVKKVCTFECDIFQNGMRQVFSAPAVSVYGLFGL